MGFLMGSLLSRHYHERRARLKEAAANNGGKLRVRAQSLYLESID